MLPSPKKISAADILREYPGDILTLYKIHHYMGSEFKMWRAYLDDLFEDDVKEAIKACTHVQTRTVIMLMEEFRKDILEAIKDLEINLRHPR